MLGRIQVFPLVRNYANLELKEECVKRVCVFGVRGKNREKKRVVRSEVLEERERWK